MEKFEVFTGVAVPLRRSNVDTDQIIPAVYLKRITKTGFEDALFSAWRNDPEFVLNQEPYKNGQVLVAGPDFGTGSSRFRGNSGKQGLVTGVISEADTETLWQAIEANPGSSITVNLVDQTASIGDLIVHFDIDEYTKWRLLEGLDDIGLTLRDEQAITDFEAKREAWRPKTLPARN
jgi:3-isopropylmalate/(R)-2-methylmalate dehydratase small subunit